MWWLIQAEILEVRHQDNHFNTKIAYWIILWKLFEICQTVEFMFIKNGLVKTTNSGSTIRH